MNPRAEDVDALARAIHPDLFPQAEGIRQITLGPQLLARQSSPLS